MLKSDGIELSVGFETIYNIDKFKVREILNEGYIKVYIIVSSSTDLDTWADLMNNGKLERTFRPENFAVKVIADNFTRDDDAIDLANKFSGSFRTYLMLMKRDNTRLQYLYTNTNKKVFIQYPMQIFFDDDNFKE